MSKTITSSIIKRKISISLVKGLLFTFMVSSILSVILLHIIYREEASGHEGGLIIVLDLMAVVALVALCISATTVFFNLNQEIRCNFWLSFASFFALPALIIMVSFLSDWINDLDEVKILVTASFLTTNAVYFFRFRNKKF